VRQYIIHASGQIADGYLRATENDEFVPELAKGILCSGLGIKEIEICPYSLKLEAPSIIPAVVVCRYMDVAVMRFNLSTGFQPVGIADDKVCDIEVHEFLLEGFTGLLDPRQPEWNKQCCPDIIQDILSIEGVTSIEVPDGRTVRITKGKLFHWGDILDEVGERMKRTVRVTTMMKQVSFDKSRVGK